MSDSGRGPREGEGRPSGWTGLLRPALAALILLWPIGAGAVSVFDLVHDTPAMRKKYRMDIVGFSSESSPAIAPDETSDSAEKLWFTREKYLEMGETEKADAQIESLVNWRLDRDRENLVPYAAILLREAFREADTGNFDRAGNLVAYAARLAPDYPPSYFSGGYLAFSRSRLALPGLLQGIIAGMEAVSRDAYHLIVLIGRLTVKVALAVVIVLVTWGAALLARYGVHLRHDFEELFRGGRRLHSGQKKLLTGIGAVIVLAFVASPSWLLVLAIFLSWAYQTPKEKFVTFLAALLLVALPFLARLMSSTLVFLGSDAKQAVMAIRGGAGGPAQAAVLERHLKEHPEDAAASLVLAEHHWRSGNYQQAEELLRKVRDGGSGLKPQAVVNLGNLLMAKGDLAGAAEVYREALRLDAGSAAAHYNLGQVLNLQFQFAEGEEEIRKAMALDSVLISRHPAGTGGNPLRTVLSRQLPVDMLLREVAAGVVPAARAEGPDLWPASFTGVSGDSFPWAVGAAAILGLGAAYYLKRRGLTRRCSKCGRPFCPYCLPGAGRSIICPQCQHIFVVKEGVESAMRVEKMIEVRRHQKFRRATGLAISVIFPGGGQIYFGRPLIGVVVSAFSAVFLLLVARWQGPFVDRMWFVYPWRETFHNAAFIGLAAVYLINLSSAYRMALQER